MNGVVAELQAVEKTYYLDKGVPPVEALRGIDLTVPRGQYVSIMGPSGSGKSTLMNIIGCLDRPSSGRYLLGGEDVAQMDDTELSLVRGKRIGFVFQTFNLISQQTVVENVEVPLFYLGIPRRERHQMAMAAIEHVDLLDRRDHRPSQLSGGQQQRAAIARALVTNPSLLLADEPTGNLDSATGQSILNLFDQLHERALTLVLVTHDQAIARRTQRVVWLRDGQIDEDKVNE